MKVQIIIILLIFNSCSKKTKNCQLIGKWKSIEFSSNKAIDSNKDGIYNTDILNEDGCSEVIFVFMDNGKAERYYKNNRTNCKLKKSILNYVIDGNQLIFTVSGMKQKSEFKITNCKLSIDGVQEIGITKNGKQNITINSVFEKH
ncbi:lipocalin family protein [Aquimarina sp. 2-A2]|uniref:lipocalin family protein n=1 Tax=Aquimarina sp. 2-A2 TaxID=3382644 RepID=UPI00387F05E9